MSEKDCIKCGIYYLFTGSVVIVVLVVGLLPLLLLRRKKTVTGAKGDSSMNHEMAPVIKEQDNLIYREIAFSNDKRKPKENNSEEEVTYAQIKNTGHQDEGITYADLMFKKKGKQSDNPSTSTDMHTTYAEIKPMSHQSPPQDGSTDLYACVNKKKTANA